MALAGPAYEPGMATVALSAPDLASLAGSAFLGSLDPASRAAVAGRATLNSHAAGSDLFRRDDPAARLHLLLSGRVKV